MEGEDRFYLETITEGIKHEYELGEFKDEVQRPSVL